MGVFRLNHAVLYVRDLANSVDFYSSVLGFTNTQIGDPIRGAAFLRAPGSTNDHDLGLIELGGRAADSPAGRGSVGLYHLAWEVDTLADLADLARRLTERAALVGSSDHGSTKSLYGRDPDGLEFEVVWLIPAALLTAADLAARSRIGRLDLAGEIARFGADTPGGIGISRSAVPSQL